MFRSRVDKKMIPVLPKNYRSISLKAIEMANDPHVYIDKKEIFDFSEQGALTQNGIRNCLNFEIKDGKNSMVGFHDHPNEMWVSENYVQLAKCCENEGWLKIEGINLAL